MHMPGFLPKIRQRSGPSLWNLVDSGAKEDGICVARAKRMSPIANAIETRFEEVCRAELVRLRRRTASLSASDRAEIDAISVTVAKAIAAHLASALDAETPPEVCNIIGMLFKVAPPPGSSEAANPQTI
jgi:hypothetical protein